MSLRLRRAKKQLRVLTLCCDSRVIYSPAILGSQVRFRVNQNVFYFQNIYLIKTNANFQFDKGILDAALYLLNAGFGGRAAKSMSDPIQVGRILAKMVSCCLTSKETAIGMSGRSPPFCKASSLTKASFFYKSTQPSCKHVRVIKTPLHPTFI